jgi:peptide/nickel transport system substrate-binding protein
MRRWASGLVLCALSVGCGASAPAADADIIKVIIRLSPVNFDPRIGTDESSQRVHQLVYSHLLATDAALHAGAGADALAARLDNPDPLTYIVRLRSGVKFHDGHELTSQDVVYTFASFLDPDFVSAKKAAYQMLESVTALDTYTVQFKLKEPFGSFPTQLVMHIVPDGAGESLRAFPIGTGPYRFVRYVPDEQIELTAYEGYWDGLPQNAGVTLRIVPDETMRGLELRKGTADLTVNDVSPDIAYQLEQDHLKIAQAQGVDYTYIGLNMRDPVLKDKRVRQAIAYAVNRQAIVDYLRRGLARPAVGVLSPVTWAFEPAVPQFMHDVARAMRLLDEAGYPDPDGDGPRASPSVVENVHRRVLPPPGDRHPAGPQACRHRHRRAFLRVRDVLRRRALGQRSDVHAAMGWRDRSRHAAAALSLRPGAPGRLQSQLLQQPRRRPADRPGSNRADG